MTGTIEWAAVNPLCLEPERLEFLGKYTADLTDAVEIHRAGIDVYDPFEQVHRLLDAPLHERDQTEFFGCQTILRNGRTGNGHDQDEKAEQWITHERCQRWKVDQFDTWTQDTGRPTVCGPSPAG